jgi:hypothetical protein
MEHHTVESNIFSKNKLLMEGGTLLFCSIDKWAAPVTVASKINGISSLEDRLHHTAPWWSNCLFFCYV